MTGSGAITGTHRRERPTLFALCGEALWLGMLGFGGGLSVLSLIRTRMVRRRNWLTEKEFANAATIAQMLPGGAAANVLAYVGLRFGGHAGAAAGYIGFVLPGFLVTLLLAWGYVRFGATPNVDIVLAGLNAAVVGILGSITVRMLRTAVARPWQMGVAAAALLLSLAGGASPAEVALLGIAAGLAIDLMLKTRRARSIVGKRPRAPTAVALPEEGHPLPAPTPEGRKETLRSVAPFAVLLGVAAISESRLFPLALVFLRTGLGAYGGGFAIVSHLQSVMVDGHWLTARQFADAVAVGKLTPGPVLLIATFIGYILGGVPAAIIATIAILSGPYLLVVFFGTWLNRVRSRRSVRAALRGLTPAVVGLMAASAITLGDSLRGPADAAIAGAVGLTLIRFEFNPILVLALGGVARIALARAGL